MIYGRGIVNAASFMSAGLPAGSIARGSLFTIFGTRMGGSSTGLAFPLSTSARGLDTGMIVAGAFAAKTVIFQ